MSFQSATILMAAMNETFSLVQTVEVILNTCQPQDIGEFIVVVCERSTAECIEAAETAKEIAERAGHPLTILWQKRPFAGGAYRDGIDAAVCSHIVLMSSDLETDPHSVSGLIEMAKRYPDDMTTASRWLEKAAFKGYNPVKLVLNKIFQGMFSLFYGSSTTDITYGFRIAPTVLYQSIQWEEDKHPFFLESAVKPIRLGVTVHEIPTKWVARQEGESQNSFFATFKYLRPAIRTRFMRRDKILKQKEKEKITV